MPVENNTYIILEVTDEGNNLGKLRLANFECHIITLLPLCTKYATLVA